MVLRVAGFSCLEGTEYLKPLHHRQVDGTIGPGILICHGDNFVPKLSLGRDMIMSLSSVSDAP